MKLFLGLIITTTGLLSTGATGLSSCPQFSIQLDPTALDVSDVTLGNENFIFGLPQNCSGELTGLDYCFEFMNSVTQGNLTVRLSLATVEREFDSYRINDSLLMLTLNYIIDKPCSAKHCCRQDKLPESFTLATPSPGQQYVFEFLVDGIIVLEHKEVPNPPGWSARVPSTGTRELRGTYNITRVSNKLIQFTFGEGDEVITTDGVITNTTGNITSSTATQTMSSTMASVSTSAPTTRSPANNSNAPSTVSSSSAPTTQSPANDSNAPSSVSSSSTSLPSPTSSAETTVPDSNIYTIIFTVTAVLVFLLVTILSITAALLIRRRICRLRAKKYDLQMAAINNSVPNFTGSRFAERDVQLNDSIVQSNSLERTYQEVQEPHIYQIVQQVSEDPDTTSQIYDEPCLISPAYREPHQIQPQTYAVPYLEQSQDYEIHRLQSELYEEPHRILPKDHNLLRVESQPYEEPRLSRSQLHEAINEVNEDNDTDQVESQPSKKPPGHPQIYEDPIANGYIPVVGDDVTPYDITKHHKMQKTYSKELLLQDNSYNTLETSQQPQLCEDTSITICNRAHSASTDDLEDDTSQLEGMQEDESTTRNMTSVTEEDRRRIYHTLEPCTQNSELPM